MATWTESAFTDPGMVFYRSYASGGNVYNKTSDDNFNDDYLDTERWSISQSGVTITETGNRLRFRIASGSGDKTATATNTVVLAGDFDYQVDYDASSVPVFTAGHYNMFLIAASGANWVSIDFEGREDGLSWDYSLYSHVGLLTSSSIGWAKTGKLRLSRSGSTTTARYYSLGSWKTLGTTTDLGTGNVTISIRARSYYGYISASNLDCYFDNFQRNSGSYYLPGAYVISYDNNFGANEIWGIGTVSGTGLSGSPSILIKALASSSAISSASVIAEPTYKTNATDWSGGSMPNGNSHARWGIWFVPNSNYTSAPTITSVALDYNPALILTSVSDTITLSDDISASIGGSTILGESVPMAELITTELIPPQTNLARKKLYLHKRSKFITISGLNTGLNSRVNFKGFELFFKNKRVCKL